MHNEDYKKFHVMWDALLKMYGKNNDDVACKFSFKLLKEYDYNAVKDAVFVYSKTASWGKYFPTPASIITIIKNTRKNSEDFFTKIKSPNEKFKTPLQSTKYAKFKEDMVLNGIVISDKAQVTEREISNNKS